MVTEAPPKKRPADVDLDQTSKKHRLDPGDKS